MVHNPPSDAGPGVRAAGGRGTAEDRIEVRGLRVGGVHGVLPEERERPQPFEVDLELAVDLEPAGASDRLEDTVDYGRVVEAAASVVAGGPARALLESLAEAVARSVLDVDLRIAEVAVAVRKLEPPLPFALTDVGVRIVRRRQLDDPEQGARRPDRPAARPPGDPAAR
ncbi:MAG TPA: dihydroneopterin aldolase [Acidimicrobiales bacterium]|nr:dihydroneopterin aldolase [Acidimicrobiales bacterium]